MRTSILGRPRRLSRDRHARARYTLIWEEPVYSGNDDPQSLTGCPNDWCRQAWRWNLDLVADLHGNASTYWYEKEENFYKRGGSGGSVTAYDRSGYLHHVDWGLRENSLFDGGAAASPPQRVSLNYDERCLADTCGSLNGDNKFKWPDVPFKAICGEDDGCNDNPGPSFFTRKRLTRVVTSIAAGDDRRNLDEWTFDHVWIDPGDLGDVTDQILWPTRIVHKSLALTPHLTSRPIKLTPTYDEGMSNRVDSTGDGIPALVRPRLSEIVSDTGGVTVVTYSEPDCSVSDLPANPASNTRRCFPVYWSPFGGEPELDWFHKYVVDSVTEWDTTTAEEVVTSYKYKGGAAWHYSEMATVPNRLFPDEGVASAGVAVPG